MRCGCHSGHYEGRRKNPTVIKKSCFKVFGWIQHQRVRDIKRVFFSPEKITWNICILLKNNLFTKVKSSSNEVKRIKNDDEQVNPLPPPLYCIKTFWWVYFCISIENTICILCPSMTEDAWRGNAFVMQGQLGLTAQIQDGAPKKVLHINKDRVRGVQTGTWGTGRRQGQ